ncbi:PREDICTED: lipocalin-like 1 protein [Acanthisitta chloris]|uniref:lipocalin-like 1 protein n=1 Tax=Acanthisitta chloris TaxID=57068 RepID=UPI0004F0EE9F|nr:PREDICTED: lipocalin-like 1 protein [Acanthisitta chloris]
MKTVGLSLGLALLCLLRVEAEDFEAVGLDKIAGRWHITAMASNSESYLRNKDQLKMAMANIEVLEEGDLKVSFAIPTPGRCMKFESIYKPTGNPGEYHSSDRGNKTAQLVDTDGKTYAIIFATKEKDGKTLHILSLGRSQWVTPKIRALFKRFAKVKGFTDEMTWILPRQGECRLDEQ